jgi:hypothetical protein
MSLDFVKNAKGIFSEIEGVDIFKIPFHKSRGY